MQPENIIHKNIRITGRVQGVGFRYSARSIARNLGVHGFVRNLPNGDVYIEAEGTLALVEEFIEWCHEGPPRAVIQFVDVYDGEYVGYAGFEVK